MCACAQASGHEKVAQMQFQTLNERLKEIEEQMERLERRLWLTVYGVVAAILGQAFQSLLVAVP